MYVLRTSLVESLYGTNYTEYRINIVSRKCRDYRIYSRYRYYVRLFGIQRSVKSGVYTWLYDVSLMVNPSQQDGHLNQFET